MPSDRGTVVWFSEVTKKDVSLVGGKGANLGEMTNAQIPVPPGFIVTSQAYFDFLEQTKLMDEVRGLFRSVDLNDSKQLQKIAAQARQIIQDAPMPPETTREIKEAYRKLGGGLVAVRSSATAEDMPDASFAGQQSTFLNIIGEEETVAAVQACWASLFEARAIFYRVQKNYDHFKVGIAVPVQKMVQSRASGVMFTLEPVTSDRSKIIIEAIFGLGEAIVGGEITPDFYIVDKKKLTIYPKKISCQEWQLVKNTKNGNDEINIKIPLQPSQQNQQKITDDDILHLAKLGRQIEDHYQFPQDIEWAKENGKLFVLQARPITTIKETADDSAEIQAPVLFSGASASPGIASGPVSIIADASEIDKIKDGEILVTSMTTPDFVPAMKRAVAIVTNRGGRTAHAAIVSRELGIPCIVGAERATSLLNDGQVITVDGTSGKIYDGKVTRRIATTTVSSIVRETIRTKTKVYVNLAQPELAEKVAAHNVDGVGLLRAEFTVAQIGEHPRYMMEQNRGDEFVSKLADGISIFTRAFDPRPVVYRTTDFKTNEYRKLRGGEKYERDEENPMLGYRGASRYIADLDIFKLELEMIKKVRQNYKNLWVMIPFVRTVNELRRTKEIIEAEGLKRSSDFKLWMMVEVPSNILLMEEFLDVGIDGISIGSNDLTQLILGVDRDNESLREAFDERDAAVMMALERAVKTARSKGVTSSICGQAPSVFPELTEKLVELGITSVSISPDMIGVTREMVAKAEQRLGIRT
ncbi:MAG: phosphoenolpyruvate synthase [Dehalococcoidales bacterium]|jgi:pyruvate,water dikinase|nr:phosphoenolpyruvate synthase [Dehalococcoidales bacterium]MDP6737907.1 phosphoenolpyruvate synthase [Dehalococcoidales bacterium]